MRAVWIDHGQDASYHRLVSEGITDPYFDARDPRLTRSYLAGVKAEFAKLGVTSSPGIYFCSQGDGWPGSSKTAPKVWAKWAYEKTQQIAGDDKTLKVILNCETHDVQWVVSMLKAWRSHSPRRDTLWSPEGHQAELFRGVKLPNVQVGPQCYVGNMQRIESASEVQAWAAVVPVDRIVPVLDASALGGWWTGVAFTQGRLA